MRSIQWIDVPVPFDHLLHTHSHVGFQGWIYTIIFLLSGKLFLSDEAWKKGKYDLQFKITLVILICMAVAFLKGGYGVFSIAFSTLFQGMNYWFIFRFYKDLKSNSGEGLSRSVPYMKAALLFGLMSTLAPYFVGYVSASGQKGSELYHSALYFFFHFQYNGWFLFSAMGMLFRALEKAGNRSKGRGEKSIFLLLFLATFPGYFASLLGFSFREGIWVIALLGMGLQWFVILFYWKTLKKVYTEIQALSGAASLLLRVFSVALFVKWMVQGLSLLPMLTDLAFHNRFMVLAYMHAVLLGVLSTGFLGLAIFTGLMNWTSSTKRGLQLFGLGVVCTEAILIWAALVPGSYTFWLWVASMILILGVLIITFPLTKRRIAEK